MVKIARLAFAAAFLLLNVYFAWASYLFYALSPALYDIVAHAIRWQDLLIWNGLHLISFTDLTQVVADFEALVLLLVLIASSAWLTRAKGLGNVFLSCVQVSALCFAIEGGEVWLFDRPEFYLHFTDAQAAFDIAPWFNNADLLVSALAVLGCSTLLRGLIRTGRLSNIVAIVAAVGVVVSVLAAAYLLLPQAGPSVSTSSQTQDPSFVASVVRAVIH